MQEKKKYKRRGFKGVGGSLELRAFVSIIKTSFIGLAYQSKDIVFRFIIEYI
jgi:hypothetical protein